MSDKGSVHTGLWVCSVVLAHLFAAFWLLRGVCLLYPGSFSGPRKWLAALLHVIRGRNPEDAAPTATEAQRHHAVCLHQATAVPPAASWQQVAALQAGDGILQLGVTTIPEEEQAGGRSSEFGDSSSADERTDGFIVTLPPSHAVATKHQAVAGLETGPAADHLELSHHPTVQQQISESILPAGAAATPPGQHQQQQQQGGSRPVVPALQLEWRGLACSYRTSRGSRAVLQDVWGSARSGELQALMGPSGAGKSTLLDLLALRKATGQLTGQVLLNGAPLVARSYRKLTAYVPQDDNFVPTMTAAETLTFYAALSAQPSTRQAAAAAGGGGAFCSSGHHACQGEAAVLTVTEQERTAAAVTVTVHVEETEDSSAGAVPLADQHAAVDGRSKGTGAMAVGSSQCALAMPRQTAAQQLQTRVEEVLQLMGLTQQASTLVGGPLPGGLYLRGLSGGERKRLSLAAGLLGQPHLLFLDEPTSGLDSSAALSVVNHLRQLAVQQQKMVLVCLHQPRAAIWSQFDMVTLLAGGRLMYQGPTSGMQPWFSCQLGCAYDPAVHGLPSDWVLDLISHTTKGDCSGTTLSTEHDLLQASLQFLLHYHQHRQEHQQQQPAGIIGQTHTSTDSSSASLGSRLCSTTRGCQRAAAHFWQQYNVLTWRELLAITRNPADVAGRTLTFCWVAILVGLIYYNLPITATSIRARINLLYSMLCFFLLMPFISMGLFTQDKQFYIRDTAARLYTPLPYYVAKVTATTPFAIITALACDLPLYGLTGLRPGAVTVAQHATICSGLLLIAGQVLHLSASICPNQDLAFMMAIAWTCLNLLMAGFFITFQEMAFQWMSYLRYTSAMHFAFEGLLDVELGGRQFACGEMLTSGEQRLLGLVQGLLPATAAAAPGTAATAVNSSTSQQTSSPGQLMPQLVTQWLQQSAATGVPSGGCSVETTAVLSYFDFGRNFASTMGCLLAYWAVLHLATYVALVLLARKERR